MRHSIKNAQVSVEVCRNNDRSYPKVIQAFELEPLQKKAWHHVKVYH